MSRRSRKAKRAGKRPWLGKLFFVLAGLAVLAVGLGYFGLRVYLHSEGFRKFLAAELGRAAKVECHFDPFRWDGLALKVPGFHASGGGVLSTVEADNIDTEVGFGGVGRGVWEVMSTRISRLDVELDFSRKGEPAPAEAVEGKRKAVRKQPGWVPTRVEVESLEIGEIAITARTSSGDILARGMSLKATPDKRGQSFDGEILGGTVVAPQPWLPELRIKRVLGAYRDGSAFVTKAEANAWEQGRVRAFGEWNSRSGVYSFEGDIDGVKCSELLSENWARRLTGDLSSTFSVDNGRGSMNMAGELEILNGTLTALPMLDALAAYADTRRFRVLQLNEARAKWRMANGEIQLTDIAMGSEGLIRLEGDVIIRGDTIDGRFRLGLVPGTLSNIPGAETHVFVPGTHGLLWTPLRVTGTLHEPEEDLTERLIAAAGLRMFEKLPETGETVLRFTRKAIGEDPGGAIDRGLELLGKSGKLIEGGGAIIGQGKGLIDKGGAVIEQGGKAIDTAGSLLDGILGGGIPVPKAPEEIPEGVPGGIDE